MADGFQFDATSFRNLGLELREFEPALYRGMRKQLREIGQQATEDIKAELAKSSPDGGPDTGRNRSLLAAATRVSISFGVRSAGAKITTSPSKLPAEHKSLLSVYNMHEFRHPVFGDKDTWQSQQGRPYFYGPVKKNLSDVAARMGEAIDDAMKAIGARAL
jgi:hypothetical protein